MLTRANAIAAIDFRAGAIHPDRLTTRRHAHYSGYAERMLAIYREGVGRQTRRELHAAVERVFAGDPEFDGRRGAAFCSLLDSASDYADNRGSAAELRSRVFQAAGRCHPLVSRPSDLFQHAETGVKEAIAAELGAGWSEIAEGLFADVPEFHRLQAFHGYPTARALLARYNVAQTQTALLDARRMTITATTDFKDILRRAKLAGLMHTIARAPAGYRIVLDGPASAVIETRRYGIAFANFLPGLLACQGWTMVAEIVHKGVQRPFTLSLSAAAGLSSTACTPQPFDSSVEEKFAAKWGTAPREGWRLQREAEILHCGQHCFFPDFLFIHETGFRVHLEVVGFWSPAYLEAKRRNLALFSGETILLVVHTKFCPDFAGLGAGVIEYKSAICIDPVLSALEQLRKSQ